MVAECMGDEPCFAEGTGIPPLPNQVAKYRDPNNSITSVRDLLTVQRDAAGRFAGATLNWADYNRQPLRATREWDGDNYDEKITGKLGDTFQRSLRVHEGDRFTATTEKSSGALSRRLYVVTGSESADGSHHDRIVEWLEFEPGVDDDPQMISDHSIRRDQDGKLIEQVEHFSLGRTKLTSAYEYDAAGSLIRVVQPGKGCNGAHE